MKNNKDNHQEGKPKKQRKENYEEKLKINGTLFDVLKVAVTPKPEEKKEKEEQ